MPQYQITVPGQGKFRVNSPTDLTDAQVWEAVQGQLAAAPAPAPAPSTERTTGEAFKDIGASVVGGFGSLLQVPGQLAQLVPGLQGLGQVIAKPGEFLEEKGESLKSQGLKVREALRSEKISEAEKEGILSSFATAISETIKDPALLSTFITGQLPQLLGPLAAAKVGKAVVLSRSGLQGEKLAEQVGKVATRSAIGAGAAMQGADISSDTYKQALEAAQKQGMSEEEANAAALNAARKAFALATPISVASQFIPGGAAIERRLAGVPGAGRIKSAVGEAVSEGIEEGGGAFATNVGVQGVDPTRELTQGIGAAAGLGTIGGGILGGVLGKSPAPEVQPGMLPGETERQAAERLQAEILALQERAKPPAQGPILSTNNLYNLIAQPNGYGLVEQYKQRLMALPEQTPEVKQAIEDASFIQRRSVIEAAERRAPKPAPQPPKGPDAGKTVTPSGGEGAQVAGEPGAGAATEGVGTAQPSGVVPAVADAGQPSTGEGSKPAPVGPTVDALQGSETRLILPDGEKRSANWEVIEADSVSASMIEGRAQPRDRQRAASNAQVQSIANNPDFDRLSDTSQTMDYGAPTLTSEYVIVGGNGRFEGVNLSYNTEAGQAYKQNLISNAQRFGLDPAQVSGMKKPVLIRKIPSESAKPEDTRKLAIQSNIVAGLEMSDMERAALDSERMTNLQELDITDTGDIPLTTKNMGTIRDALKGYTKEELSGMLAADGSLSQSGLRRVKNAVLYKAYGKTDTLSRLLESPDADLKNVGTALMRASGSMSRLMDGIKSNAIPADYDIIADLTGAVETLSALRASGTKVQDFINQSDMFGDGISNEAKTILTFLDQNLRSAKSITEFLNDYANAAISAESAGDGLFGEVQLPSKQETIERAAQRQEAERAAAKSQQTIFEQPAGAPAEEGGEKPEGAGRPSDGDEGAVGKPAAAPAAPAAPPVKMKIVKTEVETEGGKTKGAWNVVDASNDQIVDTFNTRKEAQEYVNKSKEPKKSLVEMRKRYEAGRAAPAPVETKPEPTELDKEIAAKIEELGRVLSRIMGRFGLKDVALNLVENMKAEGEYSQSVIRLALDAVSPVQVLRHESIHALKELGFFTPQQWAALERQAKSKWVDQYLKNVNINKEPLGDGEKSRYDAYSDLFKSQGLSDAALEEAIIEEAIADAFGDFDVNKAPPGLMQAILTRLRNFFDAIKTAFGGEITAEQVFRKVEKGEIGKVTAAGSQSITKESLRVMRGEEVPNLGKKVTVDMVGKYFDEQIIKEFGGKLDYNNPEHFDRAVKQATEEVQYQIKNDKSGLDWYEEDIQKAFKDTAKILPELKKKDNRILFSVIAGIMSPQTIARDNWFIAAKAFEHYVKTGDIPGNNPENGNLWMGGTQSANKKVQLEFLDRMVKDLGQKNAIKWMMTPHPVSEINEFRSKYGNIKSGIDGKATDIKPGLYAFGPKIGPFVSNINGIHDVTVDKWFTRTFNRYFGTMIGPDGKIVDAPTEPQRRFIKELANKVAENAGIKNYQVQSLLWFYEQRLFTELGAQSPSYGFSDGAVKFLESRGKGGGAGVAVPAGPTGAGRVKPSLRKPGEPVTRENILGAMERAQEAQPYMNCQLCVQMATGVTKLRDLPKVKEAKIGDIYTFGETKDMAAHYAVELGDGDVAEVEQWGEKVRVIPLSEVVDEYGEPSAIRRPPETAYSARVKPSLRAPQTEAFKKWFGDSKVVDENGEPLVVYHGSDAEFDIFDTEEGAFFFGGKGAKSFAETYGDNITPVYLSIKKPFKGTYEDLAGADFDVLAKNGYDGAVFVDKESGLQQWVAFKPTQIKSATGNIGTFDAKNPDIRYSLRDSIGLYSELENKVAQGPNKAPAASWKAYINGLTQKGVKPEEIEWSGVRDWLDLQTGPVSKDAVNAYLKQGGVKVEEVVLGGRAPWRERLDLLENRGFRNLNADEREELNNLRERFDQEGPTPEPEEAQARHGTWVLPGGKNYREVLLTLPTQFKQASKQLEPEIRALGITEDLGDISLRTLRDAGASEDLQRRFDQAMTSISKEYRSTHWDQPNVIAHIRLNDRTDADGNKVLFVEEIQSDWGQEGKKKGFGSGDWGAPYREWERGLRERAKTFYFDPTDTAEEQATALRMGEKLASREDLGSIATVMGERQQMSEAWNKSVALRDRVPTAPFVTKTEGWLNLALKRIMVMAAEGGYDKVAFVNGEQSAERYDLSKQVTDISYKKNSDGTYRLTARDKDGRLRDLGPQNQERDLEGIVGKEIAQKIIDGEGTPYPPGTVSQGFTKLSGLDLKVGGEGMKTFYNQIVPLAVKKLLPKVGGGQMGMVEFGKEDWIVRDRNDDVIAEGFSSEENARQYAADYSGATVRNEGGPGEQPGFSVTPEMKQKVETTGLPRFSLRSASWSDKRVETLLDKYSYLQNGREKDTKAYAAFVRPEDFLAATTPVIDRERLESEKTPLDVERLAKEDQEIFLDIKTTEDEGVYQITGHEGRHRMMALRDSGVTSVPVVLYTGGTKNAEIVEEPYFKSQEHRGDKRLIKSQRGFSAMEMIPINWDQRNNIKETFGGEGKVKFSLRASVPRDIHNRIVQTTVAREEQGFVQRITEAISPKSFSSFRAAALNRYNQLGVYDKKLAEKMGGKVLLANTSAEAAALLSDLGAGLTASALGVHDRMGGVPVYKNGITTISNLNNTVKGPTAIFAPLAKYGDPYAYQAYQYWAGVKRGSRFMADGKEQLFQPADIPKAEALRKQFLKDGVDFEAIQKDWLKYNDGLVDYMVATGVLSKERADLYKKHADYLPFYRQMDGETTVGPKIFQAISGVKPPKKLKGGEAPIDDFLENIVRNTQAAIQAGVKNVASQRAADVAVKIQMADRLDYQSSAPNTFQVLENGKVVTYSSEDMIFINAIKSLGLPDLPFIGFLSGPANLLRNLVTKDPAFMLANLMRDSMSAWVTSGVKMTPLVDTFRNFGSALTTKDPAFQALMNAGILGGYEFSQNVEQSGREFGKALRKQAGVKTPGMKGVLEMGAKPFTSLWEALEKGTTASDAATRMEVYKKTLAETGNEAEALYRALEVMNFNRKGSSAVIRVLTAAVPFLNARIQGLDVLYRAATGKIVGEKAAEIQRRFFVRGATIAAISAAYWLLTHDDEEYKKQEQETRDNYWLLPSLGVKIPIPFEIGVLFKVIPERILAYTFGSDTGEDFIKSMARQLTSTLAFNPIPQTVLPVVETMTNFSFFTMRPIVGQGLEGVQPAYQVGPGTSRLAEAVGDATKGMAKELQISPTKLDQLISGYTGTMGMYLVNLMDAVYDMNADSPKPSMRFERMPVIRRFALDPEARGSVTGYYDLKNSVDSIVRTSNMLERTMNYEELPGYLQDNMQMLAAKDYLLDLEKTMKEFREMKIIIRSSKMDADVKKDAILSIDQMENQLTANIQYLKSLAKGG